MYTLYYAPDNASIIVRMMLEDAGLPYAATLVDRRLRQQDSAAYRALNPAGLIPTLVTADGPVSETGAIVLWLGDRHGLCPSPASPDRGAFLKWLFFLSNTAHADLRQMFYPGQYVPAKAAAGHRAIMAGRMRRHFGILDAAVQARPDLFRAASGLAFYLCALMRWSVLYPLGQPQWFHMGNTPALAALARDTEALPATRAVALAEGLGPHPFTAPDYAAPAEGSAI